MLHQTKHHETRKWCSVNHLTVPVSSPRKENGDVGWMRSKLGKRVLEQSTAASLQIIGGVDILLLDVITAIYKVISNTLYMGVAVTYYLQTFPTAATRKHPAWSQNLAGDRLSPRRRGNGLFPCYLLSKKVQLCTQFNITIQSHVVDAVTLHEFPMPPVLCRVWTTKCCPIKLINGLV